MKTTTLYLILTAVAGVLAAPYSEIKAAQLETRATCKSPSICSVFWSGRCEAWCGDKLFSHMTGDGCKGLGAKKCCCRK
ncbi:uncharacterized protein QC763_0111790 [Podospora pseudopauciseta]|uniref:Uncharacterized protein n=1 Tax=Podospora pseudopauciseta TaxID=2093780 RepID=A0ABR0H325_9PEZI|nr:hypothetical protein QC763_0111790 [Podospora pseudopauciseta]